MFTLHQPSKTMRGFISRVTTWLIMGNYDLLVFHKRVGPVWKDISIISFGHNCIDLHAMLPCNHYLTRKFFELIWPQMKSIHYHIKNHCITYSPMSKKKIFYKPFEKIFGFLSVWFPLYSLELLRHLKPPHHMKKQDQKYTRCDY